MAYDTLEQAITSLEQTNQSLLDETAQARQTSTNNAIATAADRTDVTTRASQVNTQASQAAAAAGRAEAAADDAAAIALGDAEASLRQTFDIWAPDPERRAVEAATGGRCTIIRAPNGQASYMHIIPKFRCEDVAPGGELGTGVHPAFIVGGVEKDSFMVGMYQAYQDGSHFVSQPQRDPHASIDLDAARAGMQANGSGWHLMTNWEWAAIALWCMANGYQPTGNTNWGRSHVNTWETGRRADGGVPGNDSGVGRNLTGSGPMSWRHDGSPAGISDLVGSVWEWVDGLKLQDGRIILAPDNDYALSETGWVAQDMWLSSSGGVTFEATEGDVVRDGEIGDDGYGNSASAEWRTMGGDPATQLLTRSLIMPNGTLDPEGRLYVRNYGERLPCRGGSWSNGGNAGLAALALNNPRTSAYGTFGFRPAFINP